MIGSWIRTVRPRIAKAVLTAIVAVSASMLSTAAQAASVIDLSTGSTHTGTGNTPWAVAYSGDGGVHTTVDVPNGNFPIPPWVSNDANSNWIAPTAFGGGNAPAGDYVYSTTFTLTDPGSLFSGRFLSDNQTTAITLTGNTVTPTSNSSATSFTEWTDLTHLVLGPGSYTLSFTVNNAAQSGGLNPTGFRFQGSVQQGVVPEPSSLLLSAIGALALGRLSWKKRLVHRAV